MKQKVNQVLEIRNKQIPPVAKVRHPKFCKLADCFSQEELTFIPINWNDYTIGLQSVWLTTLYCKTINNIENQSMQKIFKKRSNK